MSVKEKKRGDWGWLKAYIAKQSADGLIDEEDEAELTACADTMKLQSAGLPALAVEVGNIAGRRRNAGPLSEKEFLTLKLAKRVLYGLDDMNATIENYIEEALDA